MRNHIIQLKLHRKMISIVLQVSNLVDNNIKS
jgi:hypothetical protein